MHTASDYPSSADGTNVNQRGAQLQHRQSSISIPLQAPPLPYRLWSLAVTLSASGGRVAPGSTAGTGVVAVPATGHLRSLGQDN
jgi:hypothetical protein